MSIELKYIYHLQKAYPDMLEGYRCAHSKRKTIELFATVRVTHEDDVNHLEKAKELCELRDN